MGLTKLQLGMVSLTTIYTENRPQMIDRMMHLVDELPPGDEALGRIILVMPDTLRRMLEWPDGQPPEPFLLHDALVFTNPKSRFLPREFRRS